MLWVEEIADLQEVIASQQRDGLARGLTMPAVEAEVMVTTARIHVWEIARVPR